MATKKKTPKNPASSISGRLLDARPDRLDLRDVPYRPPLRSLPPVMPGELDVRRFLGQYVQAGLIRDQGKQGACTGFGLACVANYLLWTRHLEQGLKTPFISVSPRMLYELAKRYDEWPGIDYDGSSCRGALKGWHKHGVCGEIDWPYTLAKNGIPRFVPPTPNWAVDATSRPLGVYYRIDRNSVVDMQAAIVNIGAIYVSANAHDGWDSLLRASPTKLPKVHADLPSIPPISNKKSAGGHAFALVGYNDRGFVVQNSWGKVWGTSGFAVLPYDDWVVNGTDAWAVALGVPVSLRPPAANGQGKARPLISARWRVGPGQSLGALDRTTREPHNPADDPWPIDHPFNHQAYEPWSTDQAYEHTLVTGNDGELSATDFTRDMSDKAGLAAEIVREAPQAWFKAAGGNTLRIAVYAHGGLNNEAGSIKRIRVLGPCFQANEVYPIFLTWKTGVGETLADMTQDWVERAVGSEAARSGGILTALGDAKDRAVEAFAHLFGKGVWSEMRENAAASIEPGHGLDLLLQNLLALRDDLQKNGKSLEIHLVGHSAGAILLGHFVSQLASNKSAGKPQTLEIRTTTLYAAACSSGFANRTYANAASAKVLDLAKLWLYVLSDENETADGLPTPSLPAYGKSLLYLVSRALDDVRKMPLLGMHRALLAEFKNDDKQWDASELPEIQAWLSHWPQTTGLLQVVDTPQVVTTRELDSIQSTHGSFDNNVSVIGATIERIRGRKLIAPLEWLDY